MAYRHCRLVVVTKQDGTVGNSQEGEVGRSQKIGVFLEEIRFTYMRCCSQKEISGWLVVDTDNWRVGVGGLGSVLPAIQATQWT